MCGGGGGGHGGGAWVVVTAAVHSAPRRRAPCLRGERPAPFSAVRQGKFGFGSRKARTPLAPPFISTPSRCALPSPCKQPPV